MTRRERIGGHAIDLFFGSLLMLAIIVMVAARPPKPHETVNEVAVREALAPAAERVQGKLDSLSLQIKYMQDHGTSVARDVKGDVARLEAQVSALQKEIVDLKAQHEARAH